MSIKEILTIVAYCIVAIACVATALLSYLRGKQVKADPAQVSEKFADIMSKVLSLIAGAENAFSSVPHGGALKLKDVLGDIKELCEVDGIEFDKAFWTQIVNKGVELINIARASDEKPAEGLADKAPAEE